MKNLFLIFAALFFPFLLQAQYPTLDQNFNDDGVFFSDLYIVDIAVQPDKKIVVLGRNLPLHQAGQTKLIRLNPDQGIDDTFGTEGEFNVDYSVQKIYVQPDGKIIFGGTTSAHDIENVTSVIRIDRLTQDGSVDTDFGDNGRVYLDNAIEYFDFEAEDPQVVAGGTNEFADLGFQSDGKIVVVGRSTFPSNYFDLAPGLIGNYQTFSTFRINTDGTLDPTYMSLDYFHLIQNHEAGKIQIPIFVEYGTNELVVSGYPSKLIIQPDDKILIAGRGVFDLEEITVIALVRLNSNGAIDNSFNNGKTTIPGTHQVNLIENMALQDDGKIIIGGTFWNWYDEEISYQLLRLNQNGTLDETYGNQGIVSFPNVSWDPDIPKIFLLPTQDLLVYNGINSSLIKLRIDGTIDEEFTPPITGNKFALQDQERLLVAGDQRIVRYINFMEPESEPIVVQKFTLYNAQTNEELFELEDGQVINLQEIGTNEINIRAYTDPEPTGSVRFNLTGAQTYSHIENNAYYALFQNSGKDFFSWTPELGTYNLTATPYSESNARGEAGTPLSISFTITDEEILDLTVEKLTLINAVTNQELFEMEDGQVINLQEIGTNEINIRAYSDPEPTGSVRFSLSGAENYNHIENNAYYALYLNAGEDFFSWTPTLGTYHLTATPYPEANAQGEAGTSLTISFTIIDEEIPGLTVEKFTLYNALTDQELFELTDGHIIDLEEIGTHEINIRAYTVPEPTGSVRFNLTGAQSYTHIENNAYYALFQNAGEDFFSWTPSLGNYQLTATPYTEANAQGEAGSAMTISFSIVNTAEDNLRMAIAYPNPGTHILNIPVSFQGALSIIILDLSGKEVKVKTTPSLQGSNHFSLNVSELEKKAYIIKIIEGNEVKTLRWVKH